MVKQSETKDAVPLTPMGITAFLFCVARVLHKTGQSHLSIDPLSFRTGIDSTFAQILDERLSLPIPNLDAKDAKDSKTFVQLQRHVWRQLSLPVALTH